MTDTTTKWALTKRGYEADVRGVHIIIRRMDKAEHPRLRGWKLSAFWGAGRDMRHRLFAEGYSSLASAKDGAERLAAINGGF